MVSAWKLSSTLGKPSWLYDKACWKMIMPKRPEIVSTSLHWMYTHFPLFHHLFGAPFSAAHTAMFISTVSEPPCWPHAGPAANKHLPN